MLHGKKTADMRKFDFFGPQGGGQFETVKYQV